MHSRLSLGSCRGLCYWGLGVEVAEGPVAEEESGEIVVEETRRRPRRNDEQRLEEMTLDGVLEAWPLEPPKAPKTALDATRLALIASPGQVHRLSGSFSDVGRAAKMAQSFRRAKPATLDPGATGRFDARAFFDPAERKWRVATRYLPPEAACSRS